MQYGKPLLVAFVTILSGCAGSASHKVVANDPTVDLNLSCQQAEAEIMRAQSIINGVNDDKADVSGADVMDGILWFPFNLIAKESNYNNALNAANQRVLFMRQLKKDKNCPEQQIATQEVKQQSLDTRIRELNQLYKDGLLTEEEYLAQKKKVLDSI
jgi:hypothetical protein